MRLFSRLWAGLFPQRASTQTWMILTFGLFVGIAVLSVGLYTTLVLQGQIRHAKQQTLLRQAENIVAVVEQALEDEEVPEVTRAVARLADLHITIMQDQRVLINVESQQVGGQGPSSVLPGIAEARARGFAFGEETGPAGERYVYAAAFRPETGLVVRVAQPEPMLFALIRQMLVTLILGMTTALLLALIGSWLAAEKVIRPLQTIRNSARAISEGHIEEKISVDSRAAEFQDLAKSLNRMSDSFIEKIDELERLARLQNEFIGNVSHEVRNPIFAIGGYLEALALPNLNDDQRRRYAEKALSNLQRLNNLFNDLIEIARLEYREDLIKPRVFNLQDLLDEVTDMLEPKAHDKQLTLVTDNPPVDVLADRNRIRQVLINLIDNAIAYSDEGSVRCRFARRADKVRIEVVDNGRGIPEEHLERIFERFHRVDPDRSRKSGGTGLGLSIVKQILHAHGEQVHVESTLGRGTRFWFDLPYAPRSVPAEVA